jgi:undecaprenyl-diphosphatase
VILQAIVLGIIQGLTEFMPISSSAHLVVVPWLFGWNDPALASLSFDVALHMGTLLALLVFFARDWGRLIEGGIRSIVEGKIGDDVDRRMAWFLVIACIPGGIAGVLLESKIESTFHVNPIPANAMVLMGVIIAVMGGLLFLAERLARHTRSIEQVTLKDSILIGLAQALAVFPGVSRSGSTITAGLAVGLDRESAARFSFLLATPIVGAAGVKSLFDLLHGAGAAAFTRGELMLFPLGFAAAAVSGFLCIKYLLKFLRQHSTNPFVYYRWALAVLVIAVALIRR